MPTNYTISNEPNRGEEILAEIAELLDVTDPDKIAIIRNLLGQAKKGYENRCVASDISMSKARKECKGLLTKLEELGAAEWFGSATFNPFDEAPEARAHDQRFRELCRELMEELRYRQDYWPLGAGDVSAREMAEGSAKPYLGTVAVELVARYRLQKLSKTERGLTTKIAELLYELATGKEGTAKGVGMLRHVRTAFDQYRASAKATR